MQEMQFLFLVSGEPMVLIHIKVGSLAVKEKVDFSGKKPQKNREGTCSLLSLSLSLSLSLNLCLSFPTPSFFLSSSLPPYLDPSGHMLSLLYITQNFVETADERNKE